MWGRAGRGNPREQGRVCANLIELRDKPVLEVNRLGVRANAEPARRGGVQLRARRVEGLADGAPVCQLAVEAPYQQLGRLNMHRVAEGNHAADPGLEQGGRNRIEFTFRDAKQYWGLEDFMVITEAAVTNAMNLAFFMVNLSRRLMWDRQDTDPNRSVLDLKAHYRELSYAEEVIKLLPEKPEPGLLRRLLAQVTGLGRIHRLPADRLTG